MTAALREFAKNHPPRCVVMRRRFRAFRWYWRVEVSKWYFGFRTPLFSFIAGWNMPMFNYAGCVSGFCIAMIPASWKFDVAEGAEAYRYILRSLKLVSDLERYNRAYDHKQ